MRVKKAGINVVTNFITYFLGFLPVFIARKVFLDVLGEELLGLSSLYTNIVGMLSIVELGIGTAIIFALYKPFAEDDRSKIKAYIKYYRKFYTSIGLLVLVGGVLLVPFLKIFIKNDVNMTEANIYFILFLLNTVVTYLFSYKISLLYVSQQTYKVSIANTINKVVTVVVQIVLLKILPSYYIYLIVQLIFNCLYYFIINRIIDKQFSWINEEDGELTTEEKGSLSKNVKSLFLHKIGGLLVLSTDNIVISYFLNLNMVAKYNSYNLVISSLQSVIVSTLASITSSVGNLLTENNKENSYLVHKRLFFLNFWIAAFVTIGLFNAMDQLIVVWMGESQLLNRFTITVVLINFYFMLMRNSVESFKEAGGLYYQDRFASIIEAVVNLVSSIILVNLIGLPGVFIGTLISNVTVLFWVKPKIVYKYIFKKPLINYFITYIKYLGIGIVVLFITRITTAQFRELYSWGGFILNCIINVIVINLSLLVIFWRNEEFNYFKGILGKVVNSVLKR